MNFKIENKNFYKDGKPYFLISGEIHYFRVNPRLWKKHLELLKSSGANTASTYIPWDWHEYDEGKFDFTGVTHPARNLIKFMELCKTVGLDLIVKPGPYILAEYDNQGLPMWLPEKLSKNAFALDEWGNIISRDLVSYLSDEYMGYAYKWFDKIMPIISAYQDSSGGPIIMMQICNEVGVFQWLSGRVDYNPNVISLFLDYIKQKYQTIEALNSVYTTEYAAFNEYEVPTGMIKTKQQYCAYFDFHLFFRYYYNLYISTLKEKIKSYSINVTFTHNIPGWIYGQASELPMLISTYSEIFKNNPDIIFGLDHIPEFVSFRNAHSDLACNKILEAYQQDAPVWAAEFQSGSREHHVRAYPEDLETFYFASVAHGMRGFNYYMFSQGINPEGKGFYGKTFYYQTALDAKANVQPLFSRIKKINNFLKKEGEDFVSSETRSSVCIGLYKPYFYTEVISSQLLRGTKLNVGELGLYIDPRFLREEILFNGVMRVMQALNYNYDVKDLQESSLDNLLAYDQLWITSTEFMDAATQNLLADYVSKGGHLVLYPAVPTKDLYLNKCAVLKERLDINFTMESSGNKVNILGINDVYTNYQPKQIFTAEESDCIATTTDGKICGVRKKVGLGTATVLGIAIGYSSSEHLEVYDKLVSADGIKKSAKLTDPEINYVERTGKKFKYKFFINYHNEKKSLTYKKNKFTVGPLSYKMIKEKIK